MVMLFICRLEYLFATTARLKWQMHFSCLQATYITLHCNKYKLTGSREEEAPLAASECKPTFLLVYQQLPLKFKPQQLLLMVEPDLFINVFKLAQ